MAVVAMNYLLEAGVHFGHQTKRWNPKMKEYIFTAREDIYIIDLQKTVKMIEEAYKVLHEIAKNGGKVLFVGTKKQAQEAAKEEATRCNMYFVSERWLGGTLTNFKTIRGRVRRLEEIERMEKDGTFEVLPKKEVIKIKKEYDKLNKYLCGIREMRRIPEAMIIVDSKKEYNAIMEARRLNIPVFGIIDTNCDPDLVDYVIPGNDDAVRAVKVVLGVLANAIVEANGGRMVDFVGDDKNKVTEEATEAKPVREFKPAVEAKVEAVVVKAPVVETKVEPVVVKEAVKEAVKEVEKEVVAEKVKEVKKVTAKEEKIDLTTLNVTELKELAKEKGIKGYTKLKKDELVDALK